VTVLFAEEEYLRMDATQKESMGNAAKLMLEHYPDAECKLVILVRSDLKMKTGKVHDIPLVFSHAFGA
jgi:hypothetical protein